MRSIVPMTAPPLDTGAFELREEFTSGAFPADLADWIAPAKIQALAQRLAQRKSNRVVPVFSFSDRRMTNPWRLLALWLYCAARGICTPGEVHRFATHDAHARELCAAGGPSAELIGRFRDQNVAMLTNRLEELLATSCLLNEANCPFARCFELYVTGKARAEANRRLLAIDGRGQ